MDPGKKARQYDKQRAKPSPSFWAKLAPEFLGVSDMSFQTRRLSNTAIIAASAFSLSALPSVADTFIVSSPASGDGPGTFATALQSAAAGDEPSTIFVNTNDIETDTTLVYTGSQPLTIMGAGQTISAAEDVTLFSAPNGADVTIIDLTFAGPGGSSIETRSNAATPGKGIFLGVPSDASGTVSLRLVDVTVTGTSGHAIHVSDCDLGDQCGGGGGGEGTGSDASIAVELVGVTVDDTANGSFDADGLRVDERGPGDIIFGAVGSHFIEVGADGVELDEGQDGDVHVRVMSSSFVGNGGYCDPAILTAFLPDPDEAEFEPGEGMADAIPGPITGSPDDGCFKREVELYDDGSVEAYEFGIDVDDGFDIDEAGDGGIFVNIFDVRMDGNRDEGFDFDEEDAGDIAATFQLVAATGNTDDAVKLSESGDGGVAVTTLEVRAEENGGIGLVFEEEGSGNLLADVIGTFTSGNDGGDAGLELVQEDDSSGLARIVGSDIADGIESDGAQVQTN